MKRIFGILLSALVVVSSAAAKGARKAIVTLSDNTVITGMVQTRSDAKFRIVTEAGVGTANLGRTENVAARYGKQHDIALELVRELQFMPRPDRPARKDLANFVETRLPSERMERKWKWKAPQVAIKVYEGEPFPVRNIQCRCILNSGEVIVGTLQTIPIYVQADGAFTAKKYFLKSKQTGTPGQTMEALVYVKSVMPLDKGKEFYASFEVTFRNVELTPETEVRAIGKESLQPVPVVRSKDKPNTVIISGTHGEDPLVAIRQNGVCTAAWPGRGPDELFAVAAKHVAGQRDFYNDKKLLGVYELPDSDDVLTLVRLRRHKPDNSKETVEFMRFSVWRWRANKARDEMVLLSRGTFFRIPIEINGKTLETVGSEDFWHMEKTGDSILIGEKK